MLLKKPVPPGFVPPRRRLANRSSWRERERRPGGTPPAPELVAGERLLWPDGGHDFSRVPIWAPEFNGRAAPAESVLDSCPWRTTPQACPFGGACHECPVQVQARSGRHPSEGEPEREAERMAGRVVEGTAPGASPAAGAAGMAHGLSPERRVQCRRDVSEPSDPSELAAAAMAESIVAEGRHAQVPGLETGVAAGASAPRVASPTTGLAPEQGLASRAGGCCPACAAQSLRGVTADPGQPLPDATRGEMEAAFGEDFSGVRIHTDERAARLSKSLKAEAFTFGQEIFFNDGQFHPETPGGKRLLAHELTHTLQQRAELAGIARQGGGRTALQCVNDNLASMGVAAWLITIVGGACALVGALAGSPTGPGAAGTAAFGAILCIAGLTGLSIGMVSRVVRECIRDPNARVGLPGTLSAATPGRGVSSPSELA